jgi:endo-1,4-beta-D-glucanase Y
VDGAGQQLRLDSDLWIAWALLEAGRLWQTPQYTEVGKALLARIADEEVAVCRGWADAAAGKSRLCR